MILSVYVPQAGALPTIDPGSGIVGTQPPDQPGMLLVDYEANRHGAINIRTFADRVHHAAERHVARYPTVARMLVRRDELLWVGTFDTDTGVVEPGNSEALEAWLAQTAGAAAPDLDAELQTTGAAHRAARRRTGPLQPTRATRFYLVDVAGGIEPRAVGPFHSDPHRDRQARRLRARQDDEDLLFWADVAADGTLTIGAYTNHFFEGVGGAAAADGDLAAGEGAP